MTGRIDVHSHILPGVDDGCESLAESLQCARMLVNAGYTHSFCTPHIWPSFENTTIPAITAWTRELQSHFDAYQIPLKLYPGGEINLDPSALDTPEEEIPTYGMLRKHVLIDMWADRIPPMFEEGIKRYQSMGLTVILGHPERMRAIQDNPDVIEEIQAMGVLLQGNLQCLSDPVDSATFETVTKFLEEDRYFMLGSDLHKFSSIAPRLMGLERAIKMFGTDVVDRLTKTNPAKLLSPGGDEDHVD